MLNKIDLRYHCVDKVHIASWLKMGYILLGYGVLRNMVLKRRKEFGFFAILGFAAFLCYSYTSQGRPGKVYSVSVDYEGPDLMDSFSFLRTFDEKSLDKLQIGEAAPNQLDAEKAVENLLEKEEKTLEEARAAAEGSLLDIKPGKRRQLREGAFSLVFAYFK